MAEKVIFHYFFLLYDAESTSASSSVSTVVFDTAK